MEVRKIEKILTEVISGCGIMSDFHFLLWFLTLFFIKCSTMNMYIFVIREDNKCYFKKIISKKRFLNLSTLDIGG